MSDRFEKIERILMALNMIPMDRYYCSDEEYKVFEEKLHSNGQYPLYQVNCALTYAPYDDPNALDVWFDIYRSVVKSNETEEDRRRECKVERRRQRMLKERRIKKERREKELEEGIR